MKAISLYLLLLLALLGCRREDDPKASDPQPLGPVSAAFRNPTWLPINSAGRTHWIEYQSDSFVVPYSIRFEVIDRTADSVFWQVGSEAEPRTGRQMVVTFNDPEGPVAVRCIAKRNSPYSVDTFTKTIYILPRNTVNYLGTFEGQSTQFPGETYRIKIDTLDKHGKSMVHTAFMTNLIRGCNYDEHVVLGAPNVFTVFIQYRPPGCAMAQVYDDLSPAYTIGFYDPQNGQINIKYNSVKTNNPSGFTYTVDREHVFTGIRVTP